MFLHEACLEGHGAAVDLVVAGKLDALLFIHSVQKRIGAKTSLTARASEVLFLVQADPADDVVALFARVDRGDGNSSAFHAGEVRGQVDVWDGESGGHFRALMNEYKKEAE